MGPHKHKPITLSGNRLARFGIGNRYEGFLESILPLLSIYNPKSKASTYRGKVRPNKKKSDVNIEVGNIQHHEVIKNGVVTES